MDLFSYLLGRKSVPTPPPVEENLLIPIFEQGRAQDTSYNRIRSKYLIPIEEGKEYILKWSGDRVSDFMYVINTTESSGYPFSDYTACGNPADWSNTDFISFTATKDGYLAVMVKTPNNGAIAPEDFTGVDLVVNEL